MYTNNCTKECKRFSWQGMKTLGRFYNEKIGQNCIFLTERIIMVKRLIRNSLVRHKQYPFQYRPCETITKKASRFLKSMRPHFNKGNNYLR